MRNFKNDIIFHAYPLKESVDIIYGNFLQQARFPSCTYYSITQNMHHTYIPDCCGDASEIIKFYDDSTETMPKDIRFAFSVSKVGAC